MSEKNKEKLFSEPDYTEIYDTLFVVAKAALRDEYTAEDAVQETILCAEIKRSDFLSSKNPAGWLMNTLKNTIMHLVRAEATRNAKLHLLASAEPVEGMLVHPEVLYSGIVSDMDLHILIKTYVDGYSYAEISEEIGLSIDAINKRIKRAKKEIRTELEKN